ncbi:Hypothetical predicted protein [Mytilus galloprovincialis]|uniref:Sushi domain-containing protein n=1 Tax=Mytilus galloprovincialis TaxID=29158 RepID=A0A8B6FL03_MYTGA|nr:Hypothetical predicted protein [Mytilus galloprovincialis]
MHIEAQQKRCTFQCLLITNGRHSFTVFLYDKIEWTTGSASGGSKTTGLGGTPAQVGFDAGDGNNFFVLDASRTADIINVKTMSNIDVPGKFIFRVDSSSIKQGGCNTNGTITVTPREATMLGGTKLVISGPCFNITETVSLQMSDGIAVSCTLRTDISVTCISPQVFRTGKEVILLNIIQADDIMFFRGTLTIVNQALTKPLLLRNPSSWKYGQTVDVVWRSDQIGFPVDALISLDVYVPKVSNNRITSLVYHSFITILHNDDVAFGIYSFHLDFMMEAGILKLSSNDSQSPYYWTDMFTVNVNISDSQRICSDWMEQDQEFQLITSEDIGPCPCSLDVVLIDTTRFHVDPSCLNTEAAEFHCPYQPSAMACFKQNIPTLKGYDHQCCYDDSGVLMNPNGFDQSGFVNRYHYLGHGYNNVPYLSNFVFDTMPYQHCCVYPSEDFETVDIHIYTQCSLFYARRTPQSCLNYVPPRTARVSGDPHYVTFDGFLYTFNPVGEFVGLSNGNFTMQLRMEQFGNSQGSAVTSFVAKPFQTADVVEVQPNTIRGLDVIVNEEVADFDSLISRTLSFNGGTVERIDDEPPTIIINFDTEGFSIKIFTAVNILNLVILVSPDLQEGDFTGLFGNNDGDKENELVSRDGHLINSNSSTEDIHNRFGLSWRTLENESLFTYPNGRSHDSYQNHNFRPVIDIPQNIDPVIISDCRNNTECIYDYYVTGDQGLGQFSANASRDYDVISNLTVEVTTCGFPKNISNAVWTADGYTEGSTAFLTCGTGYYPVEAISSCMTSGYWSEINVTCISNTTKNQSTEAPSATSTTSQITSDDVTGNKSTLIIIIVSSAAGVLIAILFICVACIYRTKKYGVLPDRSQSAFQSFDNLSYLQKN